MVLKEGAHLKSFAAETLQAISILCLFYLLCYEPIGVMREFGSCLFLLKYICDIVFGDEKAALQSINQLADLIDRHHTLFLQCYGTCLAGVKIHWLFHVAKMILKFGAMNCFKPERDNKVACALGLHPCKTVDFHDYILHRDLHQLLETFDESEFVSTFICKPERAPELASILQPFFQDVVAPSITVGRALECELGALHHDQLIACEHAGGIVLGKTHSFASAADMCNRDRQHFVLFQKLKQVEPGRWGLSLPLGLEVCHISRVHAPLPCRLEKDGALICPLLPYGLKDSIV